ncbi:MAG: SDR family oxidoreductase, partial [Desulfuromonadales bacterium]|nr:SDR family oxidoreductase [Desulfuromonadales bacterium]
TEAEPSVDVQAVMLEVVAEKTGYPTEMLNMDMHLENDLGIDSIKRVEILSAVIEKVPGLPELDNNEMSKLQTIGEVVAFINASNPNGAIPTSTVETTTTTVTSTEVAAEAKVRRFTLGWKNADAINQYTNALATGSKVAITDNGTELANDLVTEFQNHGMEAFVCKDSHDTELATVDALIYLGGLKKFTNREEALAVNSNAFAFAKAVAAKFSSEGGVFVTVQDTDGKFSTDLDFPIKNPEQAIYRPYMAGLTGLVKTAGIEWAKAQTKAIDLEQGQRSTTELAQVLFQEVLLGGLEKEVGLLADGQRGKLFSLEEESEKEISLALPRGAVIVASGGARGVTAASLIELAKQVQPKIALLGRTELVAESEETVNLATEVELKKALLAQAKSGGTAITPKDLSRKVNAILANREVLTNLSLMEATGAEVKYLTCDIRNTDSVKTTLDSIRSDWGSIQAIVHGAGVVADKLIADKTTDQYEMVFATKIDGAISLLEATANDPIKMICFFSSVAGRSGNMGQSDYSMANEVLNKIAAYEYRRRAGKCVVKSINWGPWDSGMVGPALKKQFEKYGVPLISLAEGATLFANEVNGGSPSKVEVSVGGRPDGASLLPADEKPVIVLKKTLSYDEFALLGDHSIQGNAVVPFMFVQQWIVQSCQSQWSHLVVNELLDFRCLKGITLSNFKDESYELTFTLTEKVSTSDSAEVAVLVTGAAGNHFNATASLNVQTRKDEQAAVQLTELTKWQRNGFYDGEVLFHKNSFQVIESIDGIGANGLVGKLQSDSLKELVLDGGLQLALLWNWHNHGAGSLPMSISKLQYFDAEMTGLTTCTVVANKSSAQKSNLDIFFHNEAGHKLAEIKGLDLVTHFQKEFLP